MDGGAAPSQGTRARIWGGGNTTVRIYLSYSHRDLQTIALQIQALARVRGVETASGVSQNPI